MKKYRNFDSVEFNSYVKYVKENVKHVISNTKSKYLIRQAVKDYNYNPEDVWAYMHEIMTKTYPEYMLKLNKSDWRKVYEGYMDDEDLAPRLQEILYFREGKKDNDFYRDSFFEVIKEMGINPEIMKIDMALDTFGWIWTLLLIVKKAEENPFTGEFAVKIRIETETPKREKRESKTSEKKKSKKKAKGDKKTKPSKRSKKKTAPAAKTVKEKLEKSGRKVSELLVAYYMNKDKEIDRTREIGRFTSQQDACNSLGINKGVLSNYLKGRKDSVFYNNEDGLKVRIGFEKVAA